MKENVKEFHELASELLARIDQIKGKIWYPPCERS